MNLDKLSKQDRLLRGLLQQSVQWHRLDKEVKRILPANLHAYFQTACVEEGCLVLLAHNNMAASRLKMIVPSLLPSLRAVHEDIREVRIKIIPKPPKPPRENHLKLSPQALDSFDTAARKLQHHPELAKALANLVRHHKNNVG